MYKPKQKMILWLVIVTSSSLACTFFSGANLDLTPTPFVPPTTNKTLTAIFSTTSTYTPSPTPFPTLTPTPTNEFGNIFSTPLLNLLPTSTSVLPSPTVGFTPAPSDPTTTPDPNGGPPLRTGPSVAARYISPPLVVDGSLGDWSSFKYPASSLVFGSDFYAGEEDLFAEFQAEWDLKYLYIGAEVNDSKYVQESTGTDIYLGDSLEIVFDAIVSGDYYDEDPSFDDYQIGISAGLALIGGEPEAYLWFPKSKRGSLSVVNIAYMPSADGYTVEAAIPWSLFDTQPTVNQHFGFAFSVSDNDAVGKDWQQTMISNVPDRFWSNPTTWGDITLVVGGESPANEE